jgi:small conductance mechanosensitive channel
MESILLQFLNGIKIQTHTISIMQIVIVVVLTIAAFIALSIVHKKLKAKAEISGDLRKTHALRIALRAARVLVIAIGLVAILQAFGIDLTGFSALLGLAIIVVGLAIKDALQDLFAGAVIMSDKYFSVGDAVEYDGKDGIVVSFTARTTKIEFLDDRSVLSVANRNISKIRKLTHLVDIDLPLSYDVGRKEAYSVLSGICMQISGIEGIESCELKGTQEFGASAILYKIRFFCEPNDRPDIRRAVLKTIQDGLDEAGLQIPYQQIDIHEK